MNIKHTPGPWTISGQSVTGKYITIKAANGRTVARVPFDTILAGENGTATDEGDAYLIAAAPDLLDTLIRAEQQLDYG